MKAIIARPFLASVLIIGWLLILPITAPRARASEVKPHGSAEDMRAGLREPVSAAKERESRSIYAVDGTGSGAVANEHRIAKHEMTNEQYADFSNKVDAAGTNPNAVAELLHSGFTFSVSGWHNWRHDHVEPKFSPIEKGRFLFDKRSRGLPSRDREGVAHCVGVGQRIARCGTANTASYRAWSAC